MNLVWVFIINDLSLVGSLQMDV